jgi:ribosomal protein S18 acetylase RimI-like enzyme
MVMGVRDEDDPETFDVFAMWVAPEARGQGHGRRLLDEIEAWVRSVGGRTVRLSVTDQARAAAGLYRSAGYEPDGRREESRHTPGLVEIHLRKRLD